MMDEYDVFFLRIFWERKGGRKEGKMERRKEGRKERRNETRRYPPFLQRNSVFLFFDSCIYLVIYYFTFVLMSNSITLSWAFSRRAL